MERAGPPTGPAGSDDRDDGAPRRLQPTAPPTEMPASAPSPGGGDLAGMTIRGGDDATMVSAITMDSDMDPLLGAESARRHRGGSAGHMGTVDEGNPHSAGRRTEVPPSGVREPGPDDPWLDRLEARIRAQSDSEAGGSGISGGIGVRGAHQGTGPTSPGAAPSAPTDRLQRRIEQRRREKMKAAGARSLSSSRHSSSAGGDTGPPGEDAEEGAAGGGRPPPPGAAPADDLDLLTERIGRKSPGGDVFDLLAKRVLDQLTDRKDGPAGGVRPPVLDQLTDRKDGPAGGVSRGQTFRAPFELGGGGDGGGGGGGVPASVVPQGRWKDGLCDCCTFGCFHPALWMAIPLGTSPESLEVEFARCEGQSWRPIAV
ncbi:hypothetical protein THAOC_27570 [Thalassiosira oceanica]|uniref:Uncharacterized protein n=1 Tax=Thalassiosira oceanica TaxID=159749 RepID=K0S2C4_THAOC|nr:hypothetical protein THAOC_27570 [Thalassiosira oceanica]|eukprot:EJK53062.1 hypothetical protein THAOC_27570 [Thalassiosira oceanica]